MNIESFKLPLRLITLSAFRSFHGWSMAGVVLGAMILASFAARPAFADGKKSQKTDNVNLAAILQKYRGDKMSVLTVKKKVISELLGRENDYTGTIYLSSGKIRWETDTPEKSLLVYDGEMLWNVQYPPKEFGGDIQVTKTKPSTQTKGQNLLASLFGKEKITKIFDISKESGDKKLTLYALTPKKESLDLKDIKVVTKDKQVSSIKYKDEVGNATEIEFSKTRFDAKVDKGLFKYSPPKGAKVTDL